MRSHRVEIVRFLFPALLSLIASAACYWAAGLTLGLFFGGYFIATFTAPPAMLSLSGISNRLLLLLAAILPIAAVWFIPVLKTPDTVGQWVRVSLVLFAYSMAIGSIALILIRAWVPDIFASAIAVILGLAWLMWPIWLAPQLAHVSGHGLVDLLVEIHPPLVTNGILTNEPAWTEQAIAYHLTNLNQDMPIVLPRSVLPCVGVHFMVAAVLFAGALGKRKRTKSINISMGEFPEQSARLQ